MLRVEMDYKYIVSGYSDARKEITMYYLKDDVELDTFINKTVTTKKEDIDYIKLKLKHGHSASFSVKTYQFTFTEIDKIEPYYR